jgi:myo-inositol 2-dehydrogenase / D-chiro-inositol 1-dehydrogenase
VSECRIGFVGAGGVAQRHARMLTEMPDAAVVAVTDPAPGPATLFADTFGARQVGDLQDLLSEDLHAVYVCVPPFAHGPIEETVAAAGLPMFVEKPLGLDTAATDRVAAAITRAGVTTSVGHHWRYARTVRDAAGLLDGRAVRLVVGAWLDKVPPVAWWPRRAGSGGQVVEQAVHVLDLARTLVGEVDEVCAMADGVPPACADGDADVDGATGAVLRFADGAVGTLATTCLLHRKHRAGLEVYADGLALTLTENGMWSQRGDGEPEWRQADPDEAKRAADRAFVDAVLGHDGAPLVTYAEARRTHRLACAIADSAATRRPIRLAAAHGVD